MRVHCGFSLAPPTQQPRRLRPVLDYLIDRGRCIGPAGSIDLTETDFKGSLSSPIATSSSFKPKKRTNLIAGERMLLGQNHSNTSNGGFVARHDSGRHITRLQHPLAQLLQTAISAVLLGCSMACCRSNCYPLSFGTSLDIFLPAETDTAA